jgi:hypothetical protein
MAIYSYWFLLALVLPDKVAEKYVEAFGNVAKTGNTLILPGNLADMGSMVATAMSIVKSQTRT